MKVFLDKRFITFFLDEVPKFVYTTQKYGGPPEGNAESLKFKKFIFF